MKATLTFKDRPQAESFAKAWSRHSLRGHTIVAGTENVEVTVYDVTENDKAWIDSYVSTVNN